MLALVNMRLAIRSRSAPVFRRRTTAISSLTTSIEDGGTFVIFIHNWDVIAKPPRTDYKYTIGGIKLLHSSGNIVRS